MPDGGVSLMMIKLFGDNAFTAQAEIKVMNSNHVVWPPDAQRVCFRRFQVAPGRGCEINQKQQLIPAAMIGMAEQAGKDRVNKRPPP